MDEGMRVEVCLALPDRLLSRFVRCVAGSTCAQVVKASGLLDEAERMGVTVAGIGAFSMRRAPNDLVHDGDRIELYRSLQSDPKAARSRRAALQRHHR